MILVSAKEHYKVNSLCRRIYYWALITELFIVDFTLLILKKMSLLHVISNIFVFESQIFIVWRPLRASFMSC